MTTRLDWLERTCAEMADERPPLAVPYLVELDGAQWTIGSDGHGLIGFREVRPDNVYGAPPMSTMPGEALDDPRFPWPADAAGVPAQGVQS